MRIKFLSVIVSFLLVSFAFTSCLDSDSNNIEYSPNATIQAFALDTVRGVNYQFTINQLEGLIYNIDSLPVGADTIIDRILIKTLTTASGIVTMKNKNNEDSIINILDSIDLSTKKYTKEKPLNLKVWAPNMTTTKEYRLWVNVHLQDPDSLNWGSLKDEKPVAINFSGGEIMGAQKAVILDKANSSEQDIFVYSKNSSNALVAYKANTNNAANWQSAGAITGLPASVNLSSFVSFKNNLYAVADGKVYSSPDGTTWQESTALNQAGYAVHTLLASYPPRKGDSSITITTGIAAMLTHSNATGAHTCFAITDENAANWTLGEEVPNGFPKYDISSTVYINDIGVQGGMLMGSESAREKTEESKTPIVPWGSYDGTNWADLSSPTAFCPILTLPSITHYGGKFYAFGNDFATFYASITGIAWYKANKKFYFPTGLTARKGSNYSMVVDNQNFIWIICSKSSSGNDDVWRARLNKLGYKNTTVQ